MKKRLFTVALGMLSIPAMGGVAYAAVHSVPESPKPQMVIPASPISTGGSPATHDVGDDRRVAPAASTTAAPRDDPASHEVGDDRKVAPVTGTKAGSDDNPATHEVGDDRSVAPDRDEGVSDDNPATHEVGDDSQRGSGYPDHREVR